MGFYLEEGGLEDSVGACQRSVLQGPLESDNYGRADASAKRPPFPV